MVIYRPNRGSIADAMAEAKEFPDFDAMAQYIYDTAEEYNGTKPFDVDDIVVGEPFGDDWRVGWSSVMHVCVKRYFSEDYVAEYGCPQCIGHCSENYPGLEGSKKKLTEFLASNFTYRTSGGEDQT